MWLLKTRSLLLGTRSLLLKTRSLMLSFFQLGSTTCDGGVQCLTQHGGGNAREQNGDTFVLNDLDFDM